MILIMMDRMFHYALTSLNLLIHHLPTINKNDNTYLHSSKMTNIEDQVTNNSHLDPTLHIRSLEQENR